MMRKCLPLTLLLLSLLTACASHPEQKTRPLPQTPAQEKIDRSYQALAQDSRVQYIVLHYTAADLQRSLYLLTKERVSSHYLIDKSGHIYQLVDESRRAWHAGQSSWQGKSSLNGNSIGIELVNLGYTDDVTGHRTWYPFSEAQINALIPLLKDIQRRHGLGRNSILAHSDIAPQRKSDPGPMFPWRQLADAGLIDWPSNAMVASNLDNLQGRLPSIGWFQQQLTRQGYAVPQSGQLDNATRKVIAAFQMKYRPNRCDGQPDLETAALLKALNLY